MRVLRVLVHGGLTAALALAASVVLPVTAPDAGLPAPHGVSAAWAVEGEDPPAEPEPCPPGQEPGGSGCVPCPTGEYKTTTGNTACIDAGPGTYLTDPTKEPTPCPAGTYNLKWESISAADCIKARKGHAAPSTTAVDVPCKKGTYADVEGLAACKPAAVGFYVPTDAATAQLACPTATTTGSSTCPVATTPTPTPTPTPSPAPTPTPGAPVDGPISGDPCPAGTYAASGVVPPGGACTPASPGSFVAAEGSDAQTPCPPGTFSDAFGAVACTPAPVGTYVPTSGATAALPCPAATSPGASSCGGEAAAAGAVPDWTRFPTGLVLSQAGPLRRGDTVEVLGTGFTPSSPVQLWVSTYEEPVGDALTDASGVLRASFELPRGMGTGEVVVIAIDAAGVGRTAMIEVSRSWVSVLLTVLGALVVLLAAFVAWRRSIVLRRRRAAGGVPRAPRPDTPRPPAASASPQGRGTAVLEWDDSFSSPRPPTGTAPGDGTVRIVEPPRPPVTPPPTSARPFDPDFDDAFDDRP